MAHKSRKSNHAQVDASSENDDREPVIDESVSHDNNEAGDDGGGDKRQVEATNEPSESSRRGTPIREPLRRLTSQGPAAVVKVEEANQTSSRQAHKKHHVHHKQSLASEGSDTPIGSGRNQPGEEEKRIEKVENSGNKKEQVKSDAKLQQQQQQQREPQDNNVKPIAQPLIVAEHQQHYHRLPIGGQMNDSRERIESLRAQGELSRYPIEASYSERLVGYAFLLGLPLLACFIIMLLILLIFKHCRRLSQEDKKSYGSKKSGKLHRTIGGLDEQPVDGKSSPIGFISGGKVINGLKGISIIGNKEKSDSKQLTLNMELANTDEDGGDGSQAQGARMKLFNAGHQKIKYYGKLQYRVSYDFNESILSVTVVKAEKLPAMDLNGYSDPYVKVYLTPEKRNLYKTRIHRKSLNPTFNETFQFRISYASLMSQTLIMAVYDYDRFSKHDEIGQVALPISSIDLAQSYESWSELKRIVDSDNGQVSSSRRAAWLKS